ncbi:hypothetical protein [Haloquadratum walsbyi]|jgi:hypothetical protein|uniref:Halobacterial output domain-containing protein n=1 Tax=Haloquadratum walsbyi J07HQW2 TaxID=1238425 RepID=U1PNE6_9EURY|nr:hypothetical protein [Haloquadratum walsbyi]ERG95267.1 MAG: hypothetical protein J07HQW2_01718 [Haloquadratum walsbyi J07HQW2]
MVTVASTEEFGTTEVASADVDSTMISQVVESLDADIMTLDIYEGDTSGRLYVATTDGYQRVTVSTTGLSITHVETPSESIKELFRIEPDPGETVSDAIDTLSFAGD